MTQKEDESLEYLIKRFTYNVKRAKLHDLGFETLKSILLESIRDEWIDLLNLMGKGDVSRLSCQDICELYKNISRGNSKYDRNPRDLIMSIVSKFASGTVSWEKLSNLLHNFKIDILRVQNKQRDENVALSIFVLDVKRNMHYENVLLTVLKFVLYVHKLMLQSIDLQY